MSCPYLTNAPGKTIYVNLEILRDPFFFDIDLYSSPDGDDSNIALHISVQSPQNAVFFNSRIDGVWGKREKADTFPFKTRSKCSLTITTEEGSYDIAVNGTPLYTYRYPPVLPPKSVERFAISKVSVEKELTETVQFSEVSDEEQLTVQFSQASTDKQLRETVEVSQISVTVSSIRRLYVSV